MKKILAILLAMIMLLAFAGCGNSSTDNTNKKSKSTGDTYTWETKEKGHTVSWTLILSKGNNFKLNYILSQPVGGDLERFGIRDEKETSVKIEAEMSGKYIENDDGSITLNANSGKERVTFAGSNAKNIKKTLSDNIKEAKNLLSEEKYKELINYTEGKWNTFTIDWELPRITVDKENKTFNTVNPDEGKVKTLWYYFDF